MTHYTLGTKSKFGVFKMTRITTTALIESSGYLNYLILHDIRLRTQKTRMHVAPDQGVWELSISLPRLKHLISFAGPSINFCSIPYQLLSPVQYKIVFQMERTALWMMWQTNLKRDYPELLHQSLHSESGDQPVNIRHTIRRKNHRNVLDSVSCHVWEYNSIWRNFIRY